MLHTSFGWQPLKKALLFSNILTTWENAVKRVKNTMNILGVINTSPDMTIKRIASAKPLTLNPF